MKLAIDNKKLNILHSNLIYPLLAFPLWKENITMLFFVVFTLFNIRSFLITKKIVGLTKIEGWILFIPFLIVFFSSLFRNEIAENKEALNHSGLFIAIPISFFMAPEHLFSKEKINRYLNFLLYSSLALIIAYLILFFINNPVNDFFGTKYNSSLFRDFVYEKTLIFTIHPAYFSSVLFLGMAFCVEKIKHTFSSKYLSFIIVFYVFTFLLLSKLNIVLMHTLLLYALYSTQSITKKIKLISGFVFAIFTAIFFLFTPGMTKRIVEIYKSFNTVPNGLAFDSTNIRRAIYTCDFELIQENYLSGIGYSNIVNDLYNCFQTKYDSSFFEGANYMSHNYFIYTLLGSGVLGLIALLFFIFKTHSFLFRFQSLTFRAFALNTLAMCLIEDYFYRQNGAFFFLLWYLILLRFGIKNNKIENPIQ
jgi:O-antigen ligase